MGGRYVGNLKISKIHQSPMTKGSIPKIPLISSKSLDQQEKKIPRVPKLNKSFETSHTKGITTTSISRPQSSNSNRSRPSETIPIPKTTRLSSGNTSSGIHSKFLSSSPSRPTRQFNLSSPSEAPNSQSAASTRPPHRMIPPIRPPIRPSNLSLQSLRGLIGKGLGRGRPPNPAQNAGGHGNTTNSPSMTSTSTDLKNNSAKPNSIPKSKDASGSKYELSPISLICVNL